MSETSPTVRFGPHQLGAGSRPLIVAEVGINHNGSLALARKMIRSAAACGADAVKFQTFRAATFISNADAVFTYKTSQGTVRENSLAMFQRTELAYSWYAELFREARQAGILLFSTPCDPEAVALLADLDAPAFKISSDYLTHHDFLRLVAEVGRPLVVSTGMATLGDIEAALEVIHGAGNHQVILLHCVSAYPTPPEQVHLRVMETLRRTFDCPVGFSDHTAGIVIPLAAAALGAVLLEKHFTLDKDDSRGPDHWFSADPQELTDLVQGVRLVSQALGRPQKQIAPAEAESRQKARMSVVAAVDLPAGTVLSKHMLTVKRPGTGIPPGALGLLEGQIALQDIRRNQVISWDQVGRPASGGVFPCPPLGRAVAPPLLTAAPPDVRPAPEVAS